MVHRNGKLAEGPIALVEAQAYVYRGKLDIAGVYEALGEHSRATELRQQAETLRQALADAFWMPDEGTFALALDGRKRRVGSVASNAGHCLYCGVVDPKRAALMAERLMAPDMFSGWGVRTLSSGSRAYNPMSYHNGSVWPHDNAIIAAGLKRYGFSDAALRVAGALFDVATRARGLRLPEVFCGFEREPGASYVSYPVACSPQGWAAAAPFLLTQAMLGLAPDAQADVLTINDPTLPEWLGAVTLHKLRVGGSRLSLFFRRERDTTGFSLLRQSGETRVNLSV